VTIQKPKSEFEQQMMYLEAEVRRLEAEFNMFFAGRLPRPPWETRAKVAALVKKTDQSYIRNTADRFRFESVQNRYQKFLELWERQMTNKEMGRPTMGKRTQPPPAAAQEPAKEPAKETAAAKPEEAKPLYQPEKERAPAAEAEVRFKRDQALEAERVKQLHEQLSQAKKQAGETPVAMDRLAALVKAQVDKFKSEGKDVTFKVAVKDGKVSLTATPVKDE
jgi:hypothetical protein